MLVLNHQTNKFFSNLKTNEKENEQKRQIKVKLKRPKIDIFLRKQVALLVQRRQPPVQEK